MKATGEKLGCSFVWLKILELILFLLHHRTSWYGEREAQEGWQQRK